MAKYKLWIKKLPANSSLYSVLSDSHNDPNIAILGHQTGNNRVVFKAGGVQNDKSKTVTSTINLTNVKVLGDYHNPNDGVQGLFSNSTKYKGTFNSLLQNGNVTSSDYGTQGLNAYLGKLYNVE